MYNLFIFLFFYIAPYNPLRIKYELWLCFLTSNRFYVIHTAQSLLKCFSTNLANYEPAPLDELWEHYGFCCQELRRVITYFASK